MTVAPAVREHLSEELSELDRRISSVLRPLGFSPQQLGEKEGADLLVLENPSWAAAQAAMLPFRELVELAALCKGALTVEVIYGSARLLAITAGTEAQAFDEFRTRAARLQGGNLTVLLKLNKHDLLDAWGIQAPHTVIKVFLCHEALARALRVPLEELEGGLFAGSDGRVKLLILVADRLFTLEGRYLAVVGGRSLADWRHYLPAAPPDPGPVRAMHAEALQSLHWVSFELDRLTPLQLEVGWPDGTAPDGPWNPAVRAFYEKLLALSLVYTAGQTSRPAGGDELVCVFEAGGRNAEVRVPDSRGEAGDLWRAPDGQNRLGAIAALARMTRWAYGGERGSDRLTVWQRVVAEDLHGNLAAANHLRVVQRASALERHAEWSWRTFMEGKLDTYFDRVDKLEDAVDEIAGKIDEQIRGLNKALADNMLAGVAAVVGSFIVAMFRAGSSAEVFRLGLLLYAGYLLLFPGGIGLGSAWLQLQETLKAFEERLEGFRKRLFGDTVHQIAGNRVLRATRRFKIWFRVALAAYLLVVAALCVAAWKADALIP